MKKKRGIEIKINLSNRAIYTLIVIGILAIVGVGVYATVDTSKGWHNLNEIDLPSCSNGQVLGMSGGSWGCVDVSAGVNLNGWSFANDVLLDNNEQVIKTSDEWLRLNQEGHFKNGIYTPGKLKVEKEFCLGNKCITNLRSAGIYYIHNTHCENSGSLTFTSTCETLACSSGGFYTCPGVCHSASKPYTCQNIFLGYLVE
jgi:hypothetical protein